MSQTPTTSPNTTQGIRPGRLKGGAIGALGAAVMAMAFMGPATSVAFNTPPAAAKIGFALPFGILLAMLVCLVTAYTICIRTGQQHQPLVHPGQHLLGHPGRLGPYTHRAEQPVRERALRLLGRGPDRLLPRPRRHPQPQAGNHDNPITAWAAYILFAAVVTFALGAWITPFGAYDFLGSILGLGIIVLYILMNIGLVVYFRRHHPTEFSPVRHALLPIAGSLLLLLPIYGQLWPIPAWPYDLVPYLIVAWIIGGVGYFLYLKSRKPAMVEAMGRVWEPDLTPADTTAATPPATAGEAAP